MDTKMQPPTDTNHLASPDLTRAQIRGSSLLLTGRFVSLGVNFLSQVLVVRYFSTSDYGAWAYALSVVALCQGFSSVGLKRAVTRFVPIYHEKQEYEKLFGTILLVLGSILVAGIVIVGALHLWPEQMARLINEQGNALGLLLIMIFLVPVEALDGALIGLFASFSSPRAIFFRRYVLGPGLKLAVVVLLITLGSEVTFLAYGYLAASALGVLVYSWVLFGVLRRQGLLAKLHLGSIRVPAREVFSFAIPLMTSDLLAAVMLSSNAILLGYFWSMDQVAFFRVVLPLAILNKSVAGSFALLYTPAMARLFARDDKKGINELYWRTTAWVALLSFPIFAVTFSLARPLTVMFYGARYEQSWIILALLSFSYYFDVLLGFNGLTLKVLGKLRYIVTINLLAAVANVGVNLLLIPRLGALGAALGTAGTVIAYAILKQAGLRLAAGIRVFDKDYASFYLTIGTSTAFLCLVAFLASVNFLVAALLTVLVSMAVLLVTKRRLRIQETFPELVKIPLMRLILT
jgi:O-antigen/teichoic acid export membrane protein